MLADSSYHIDKNTVKCYYYNADFYDIFAVLKRRDFMEKQKTGLVIKAKEILYTAKEYWTEPPKGSYIPYK